MLSGVNIWRGGEEERIGLKEVGVEDSADGEELLGVDRGAVEQALEGALGDADALHKPFVGVALAAEFVADKVAYMYLHGVCHCALGYQIPLCTRRPQTKKKASNLVSSLRS